MQILQWFELSLSLHTSRSSQVTEQESGPVDCSSVCLTYVILRLFDCSLKKMINTNDLLFKGVRGNYKEHVF